MAKEYGELRESGMDREWVLQVSPSPGSNVPLSDDDGNFRTWESELEALNELATEDWELVTAVSQSEADHPERIFVRFFLARERRLTRMGRGTD